MKIELKMSQYTESGWATMAPPNEIITNYINTAIPRTINSTHKFPWSVEIYIKVDELESIKENLFTLGVTEIKVIRR